ncbi:MAG: hypothetical protein HOV81_11625 [Kofleriaceae bacterium]|nr:hypothetical protein [Kofleriaceae bacterium]
MRLLALSVAFVLVAFSCRSRTAEKKSATEPGSAVAVAPKPMKKRSPTLPSLPPRLPLTAVAWKAAESAETAQGWDAAAEAYEQELAGCADDCVETAYAIVLARRAALKAEDLAPPPGDEPVPLPPRAQAMVDALDQFVALTPDDPDAGGFKFLAANVLRKYRQPDALTRLEALLRENRMDQTAEYAANILIDALVQQGRMAEVRALVDELLADAAFIAGKDELRQTLERIRTLLAQAD